MRRLVLAFIALTVAPSAAVAQAIPEPVEHFGHEIGQDGYLANWDELTAYYERVADASPRIVADTVGESTNGLPFVQLTITSPENHANLDRYQEIQQRLADPRTLDGEAEARRLMEEGKVVALITNHIHSTEVFSGQEPANFLYNLATRDDEDIQRILDEVIIIHVPSLNPDGTQLVGDWWHEWKDTEFEGAPLPRLYQEYAGHNNNRDWWNFALEETQLAIEHAHNAWRPQMVMDVHQMGGGGARFFVPPYIDPVEPNVDPLLISGLNHLGKYIAAEMMKDGKSGIVTDAIFDIYTPARAYQHYHGGVRILTETASASGARSVELDFDDLGGRSGYDAQEMSVNFPRPWKGGEWGGKEIVAYQEAAKWAMLRNAAQQRDFWLENFYDIHVRAVEGWDEWPAAWVIPPEEEQAYETGLQDLLRILTMGDVEVHRAEESFVAEGAEGGGAVREMPEGTYVIPMQQPYAGFAQTMMEEQEYPDLRQYPGGPPIRPYDATAHTLPLLNDVEAMEVEEPLDVALSAPIEQAEVTYELPDELQGPDAPRVGLYRSWNEARPTGWQRWLFDSHGLAYDEVRNDDLHGGDLRDRWDVILFQAQSAGQIRDGYSEDRMPPEYAGGVGEEGAEALREFVEAGGRIIAIDQATDYVIQTFDLDIANAVDDFPNEDFYIPGSILRMTLDTDHPVARDLDEESMAWYWRSSRAFEVDEADARVIGRYHEESPRMAGWVLGEELMAGMPNLVQVPQGEGDVILFGFRPNFRGQTPATWPLLFNTLAR